MDLAIILDGWPYDKDNEANNIRKIIGADGHLKLQIRLRDGVIQWELEGRPDGARPYDCTSVLGYCRGLVEQHESKAAGERSRFRLEEPELIEQLEAELLSYSRRRMALFKIGDYSGALGDALHGLEILEVIRRHGREGTVVFQFDRHRPRLIADRARAEALMKVHSGQLKTGIEALNDGILDIDGFLSEYGLNEESHKSRERKMLIDLRRSLRERYGIPITDDELLQTLRAEQQVAIDQEDFEMAARLRDKISLLLEKLKKASS